MNERELLQRLVYIANERKPGDDGLYDFLTAIKDAEALLAQPVPRVTGDDAERIAAAYAQIEQIQLRMDKRRAEFAQPERKPLTDEQIWQLYETVLEQAKSDDESWWAENLARAVERAHGIE